MPDQPAESDLRRYLLGLDKEVLASMILDRAAEDERFRRKLTLQAMQAAPGAADAAAWKRALDEAARNEGYISYREAYDYAAGIDDVIDNLEAMLRDGRAGQVIGLAEYGLGVVEETMQHADDSSGSLGACLMRLYDIHLDACRIAPPDPTELAARLFEREMASDYDTPHPAVAYADALGETGVAAYRRLAEAAWEEVPALGPGEKDPADGTRRFHLTAIMQTLAELDGSLEAQVAIRARDLSTPYRFLEIATLYRDAGDTARALDWAERGWRSFPDHELDRRLRAFLAEAYQAAGRRDEAVTLMWNAFEKEPRLDTYEALHRHAGPNWPEWRERALSRAREHVAREKAREKVRPAPQAPWGAAPARDSSLLVEIFLWEGEIEAAWREAEAGGCSAALWLTVAEQRGKDHPEDSVRIYRKHVVDLLQDASYSAYDQAVRTMEKIKALLPGPDGEAAFNAFVAQIRTAQKRKRNLIKMLDDKGW